MKKYLLLFVFVFMWLTGFCQSKIDTTTQAIQIRAEKILSKLKNEANLSSEQMKTAMPLIVQREKLRTKYELTDAKSVVRDSLVLEIQRISEELYFGFSEEQKKALQLKREAFIDGRKKSLKQKKQ